MNKLDWSWKDPDKPNKAKQIKPKVHLSKAEKRRRKKEKRKGLTKSLPNEFYVSKEWRRLRYRVIAKYEGACMACGRSKREHGAVIHVDHIKPRSKYPHLALSFDNLQLLCEDCNLGKSNKCQVDWRPDEVDEEREILNEAIKHI